VFEPEDVLIGATFKEHLGAGLTTVNDVRRKLHWWVEVNYDYINYCNITWL